MTSAPTAEGTRSFNAEDLPDINKELMNTLGWAKIALAFDIDTPANEVAQTIESVTKKAPAWGVLLICRTQDDNGEHHYTSHTVQFRRSYPGTPNQQTKSFAEQWTQLVEAHNTEREQNKATKPDNRILPHIMNNRNSAVNAFAIVNADKRDVEKHVKAVAKRSKLPAATYQKQKGVYISYP